jgi:hypothetical protein
MRPSHKTAPVDAGSDCPDCGISMVLEQGVCKAEFTAFDACYDAEASSGGDADAACKHLVRANEDRRGCLGERKCVRGVKPVRCVRFLSLRRSARQCTTTTRAILF